MLYTNFMCVIWSDLLESHSKIIHLYKTSEVGHLPPLILTVFYRGTTQSVLMSCISVCFGNSRETTALDDEESWLHHSRSSMPRA